jgi:hypothetical protein
LRRSVRGKYQIGGPTLCASAPSHRYHAMPPRRTRNSHRPRASDRTMVATESNRLPSFKNRRALSPLENEPRERKSNPEKNLSSDREPSATSGLDIETKNFSATGRRRSFFVDIPFYRTTYLVLRLLVRSGFIDIYRTLVLGFGITIENQARLACIGRPQCREQDRLFLRYAWQQ